MWSALVLLLLVVPIPTSAINAFCPGHHDGVATWSQIQNSAYNYGEDRWILSPCQQVRFGYLALRGNSRYAHTPYNQIVTPWHKTSSSDNDGEEKWTAQFSTSEVGSWITNPNATVEVTCDSSLTPNNAVPNGNVTTSELPGSNGKYRQFHIPIRMSCGGFCPANGGITSQIWNQKVIGTGFSPNGTWEWMISPCVPVYPGSGPGSQVNPNTGNQDSTFLAGQPKDGKAYVSYTEFLTEWTMTNETAEGGIWTVVFGCSSSFNGGACGGSATVIATCDPSVPIGGVIPNGVVDSTYYPNDFPPYTITTIPINISCFCSGSMGTYSWAGSTDGGVFDRFVINPCRRVPMMRSSSVRRLASNPVASALADVNAGTSSYVALSVTKGGPALFFDALSSPWRMLNSGVWTAEFTSSSRETNSSSVRIQVTCNSSWMPGRIEVGNVTIATHRFIVPVTMSCSGFCPNSGSFRWNQNQTKSVGGVGGGGTSQWYLSPCVTRIPNGRNTAVYLWEFDEGLQFDTIVTPWRIRSTSTSSESGSGEDGDVWTASFGDSASLPHTGEIANVEILCNSTAPSNAFAPRGNVTFNPASGQYFIPVSWCCNC